MARDNNIISDIAGLGRTDVLGQTIGPAQGVGFRRAIL